MVVLSSSSSSSSSASMRNKKTKAVGIPEINLSLDSSIVSEQIVKACEEYGFFKVVNHGVSAEIILRLEDEGVHFFDKPAGDKHRAGPANPFGYGFKNLGLKGDKGELEYLLLQTDPSFIAEISKTISNNEPQDFSCAVNDYIEAVRELACKILDLVAEGLWVPDKHVFSRLIKDVQSDSCLRFNHYPPVKNWDQSSIISDQIGFGEHSDPQIITILRSNDVAGLEISLPDGFWVPVPPDPSQFYVIIGDTFRVLTNGRFESVRHRALANLSENSRMSMMFFGGPSLNATISPLPEFVSPQNPSLFKPFTWDEFMKATYSFRLQARRLDLFKLH